MYSTKIKSQEQLKFFFSVNLPLLLITCLNHKKENRNLFGWGPGFDPLTLTLSTFNIQNSISTFTWLVLCLITANQLEYDRNHKILGSPQTVFGSVFLSPCRSVGRSVGRSVVKIVRFALSLFDGESIKESISSIHHLCVFFTYILLKKKWQKGFFSFCTRPPPPPDPEDS